MITATNGQRGSGFDFEFAHRNVKIAEQVAASAIGKTHLPQARGTGTTLCGCVFSANGGGVVLASDTRATAGSVIADVRCLKQHPVAPNITVLGAGTSADCENVTLMIASELTLSRLETRKQTRCVEVLTLLKRHLYQYQGHVGAATVVGGVDVDGPFLGTVAPHGSTDRLPFVSMGSGSLGAMAMLEAGYKDGMTAEEAKELCTRAISAGIFNDPFSGTQVDVTVITKDKVSLTIGHYQPNTDKPDPVTVSWSPNQLFLPKDDRTPANPPQSRVRPTKRLISLPPGTTPIKREEIRLLANVTEVAVSSD
jgi:20S proteasome subunit beta 2